MAIAASIENAPREASSAFGTLTASPSALLEAAIRSEISIAAEEGQTITDDLRVQIVADTVIRFMTMGDSGKLLGESRLSLSTGGDI